MWQSFHFIRNILKLHNRFASNSLSSNSLLNDISIYPFWMILCFKVRYKWKGILSYHHFLTSMDPTARGSNCHNPSFHSISWKHLKHYGLRQKKRGSFANLFACKSVHKFVSLKTHCVVESFIKYQTLFGRNQCTSFAVTSDFSKMVFN